MSWIVQKAWKKNLPQGDRRAHRVNEFPGEEDERGATEPVYRSANICSSLTRWRRFLGGPSTVAAAGLGRALAASGRKTTILSLASSEAAAQVPGLARRLRTVATKVGDKTLLDLSLYEGRASLSDARLLVLGAPALGRAETAALLASAVKVLGDDALIAPEVTIGWGETTAAALSATSASVRLFALPTGRLGPPLTAEEGRVLGPLLLGDDSASRSLVALGSLAANAIFAPSPRAARANENDPALASRASDEALRRRALRLRRPAPRSRERPGAAGALLGRGALGQGRVPARPRAPLLARARAAHAPAHRRPAPPRRGRRGDPRGSSGSRPTTS